MSHTALNSNLTYTAGSKQCHPQFNSVKYSAANQQLPHAAFTILKREGVMREDRAA